MKDRPLYIAFLWHMHQPYYKDPLSDRFTMPWVRLHGIKDYYDMVAILEEFPSIKQTFNIVPSLIDQILAYTEQGATDEFMDISLKPASDLSVEEKIFILRNFFSLNWDNMLYPYPAYTELLERRGREPTEESLRRALRMYTTQDFLDLQVWFNLAWFDPMFKDRDEVLKALIEKGHGFDENDKRVMINKQLDVLKEIIPEYKKMMEQGQIELTTTPFYHPILPLLCDTEIARVSMPNITLPKRRFKHPEDARAQIEMAIDFHENIFGHSPEGMWPSEGSVSGEMASLVAEAGIKWIATDEEILAKSTGMHFHRVLADHYNVPEPLYKPYCVETQNGNISIIFRDHQLSDLIGFVYSRWDIKNAVNDFIARLHRIRQGVSSCDGDHLVTIILDGENAWEYYRNDGHDFLKFLYERLSRESAFQTVKIGEYLREHPPDRKLERLFPGSWINHNFKIWIGHEEDNTAWDLLKETRDFLVAREREARPGEKGLLKEAWKRIYAAEGSDWCWWYGEEHDSGMDEKFDELFRNQLISVYRMLGSEPPPHYLVPILREERKTRLTREPVAFIRPGIDGRVTSYYEWLPAGIYEPGSAGGAMHQVTGIISAIYYGFDMSNLFLRLDVDMDLFSPYISDLTFNMYIIRPHPGRIEIRFSEKKEILATVFERREKEWIRVRDIEEIAAEDIIEIAIPFELMKVSPVEEVQFIINVLRGNEEIERWPRRGYFSFEVPTEEFEAMRWYV